MVEVVLCGCEVEAEHRSCLAAVCLVRFWDYKEHKIRLAGIDAPERKQAYGLVTCPFGTGKTMTATVIAADLGLDLYKIDLSGVVSKYIGETEKNLDRIFWAARGSNAILFFDEADVLFGKRSEIKDAHDRYANIEIAYLLQKLAQHNGTVILANNLSKNIDQAFSRRMNYVVEFPTRDAERREMLWRQMFPASAPLSDDIDFSFLAKQFNLAGGDIKNVAVSAAFTAAENGQVITMHELMQAMGRQMIRQGKVPSPAGYFPINNCLWASRHREMAEVLETKPSAKSGPAPVTRVMLSNARNERFLERSEAQWKKSFSISLLEIRILVNDSFGNSYLAGGNEPIPFSCS